MQNLEERKPASWKANKRDHALTVFRKALDDGQRRALPRIEAETEENAQGRSSESEAVKS